MKLYYEKGACALAVRIVAAEAGIAIRDEQVDLVQKRTASGADFYKINPKGVVPALVLDNGEVLTEGPAIMQYVADLRVESGLAPANGTLARYRLQEMLGFINSEIHKTYIPFFSATTSDEVRAERRRTLLHKYPFVEAVLAGQSWLLGKQFTAADAYLFTVTRWATYEFVSLGLSPFKALQAFQERVAARPAVQASLRAEGIAVNTPKGRIDDDDGT